MPSPGLQNNRTERFSWDAESCWNNAASDLSLLGASRGALVTKGGQERERMRTLAKEPQMGRKGILNPCLQLFLKLR